MNKENNEGLSPEFDNWLRTNRPSNAMHTPEGYFDNFSDELMSEVSKDKKPTKYRLLYYAGSIAAGFAILLAAMLFMQEDQITSDYYADLTEDQSWLYLIQNSTDLSLDEIASLSEAGDELAELELEIFTNGLSDEFIDGIDIDLLEDIYE